MSTEDRQVMGVGELLAQAANDLTEAVNAVHERPTENLLSRDVEKLVGHIGRAVGLLQMLAVGFMDDDTPAPDVLDGYDAWATADGDAITLTRVELACVGRYLEAQRDAG